ncbi:hypothetical protein MAR_035696 [Mya arenaria]|uniref:DDE Tnp4 domain-containing protein n=1 Tax=Mya arenaria TaxID=6604 RepID=A0ABY7ELB0_MYAAR|nr:hypothetical protein MAR_035696 [Mya arenaria]
MIDCIEIFIQRPTNLDARASTWSNYKNHYTLKFLIGITPYGSVMLGGQVSDREITARSGFYELLDVGDLVLADRGFLIANELTAHGASLAIPPFAKGKKKWNVREDSKSLAYMLRGQSSVHTDSILTICAAFTNLLPKLVNVRVAFCQDTCGSANALWTAECLGCVKPIIVLDKRGKDSLTAFLPERIKHPWPLAYIAVPAFCSNAVRIWKLNSTIF